MKKKCVVYGLIAMLFLITCSSYGNTDSEKKARVETDQNIVYFEDFEQSVEGNLPNGWWVEGCEKVFIEDGRLRVKANPVDINKSGKVCTVWYKQNFSGNLKVEFDAHVLNSTINANNINFFFLYSDPKGIPLYDTRQFRHNAAYKLYHNLNGYIFTFLNDFRNERDGKQARMRMRRSPGFELITETFGYHSRRDTTYHVTITKVGKQLSFAVDNKIYLKAEDSQAWEEGLIGLRTFQTDLWWDNIKVTQLK